VDIAWYLRQDEEKLVFDRCSDYALSSFYTFQTISATAGGK